MDCSNISKCADNLMKTYKTNNPFKLAKSLDINLKYSKLQNLKGFYTCILKNRYIVINDNLDDLTARIVCAHEIGHDRFHRGIGINMFQDKLCVSFKTSTKEMEANFFAAELLIKTDSFLDLVSKNFTYKQIACALEVSTELVLIKGQLLKKNGYKINVPFVPKANFLGEM